MDTVTRFYRQGVFFLLLLIIAMGISLSFVISRTGERINLAATPLLRQNIPLLHHVSQLENTFLRYQVILNQYYAYSIERDDFLRQRKVLQDQINEHLGFIDQGFGKAEVVYALHAGYQNSVRYANKIEVLLGDDSIDWDAARDVLSSMTQNMQAIRVRSDELKAAVEKTVYDSGQATMTHVTEIMRWVFLYSLATVITVVFVGYHVRERVRSEAKLAFQAWHDVLTGLENRRAFELRLSEMNHVPHLVMLIVIERLERLITGLGRDAADHLIQDISLRLMHGVAAGKGDLFRLDGATFAVISPRTQEVAEFSSLVSDLKNGMRDSFEISGCEVLIGISMGAVEYPEYGTNPTDIMRNADTALHIARQKASGECVFYCETLNAKYLERLTLEGQLSHAVERGELELYYQPQLRLAGNALIGFEALVRWNHQGRLVSPADFIPVAEESGLIVPMGAWILEEACRQAKLWNADGAADRTVAVNISARQFIHPEFLSMVKDTLQHTGVNPAHIELEITESMIIQDAERAVALLAELRSLGLKLSIDDFGTGYSSLSYLKRFPIHKLKVDQSFIRHLKPDSEDAVIVQAIIGLGRNLGLVVIAEGVETSEQLESLRGWLCDEIQGYYYARPLKVDAATAFLNNCVMQ